MPRTSRVSSIACLSLALPSLARCERPSAASLRASGVDVCRLAKGPEEKRAFRGRAAGVFVIDSHPFRWAPLVGERCPAAAATGRREGWQGNISRPADAEWSRERKSQLQNRLDSLLVGECE